MSTLHERLLGSTGPLVLRSPLQPGTVNAPRSVLREALRAVVELHAPIPCGPCSLRHEHQRCRWCTGLAWPNTESMTTWPCPTITAVASALGVEIGETPK